MLFHKGYIVRLPVFRSRQEWSYRITTWLRMKDLVSDDGDEFGDESPDLGVV